MSNETKILKIILKTPYYRNRIKKKGLKVFSSEKDLFDNSNIRDFINDSKSRVSFFYFSGGVTGSPKKIPLSKKEPYERSKYRASCYKKIGLKKNNKVAILLPFGPWVAGPSALEAVKMIGCTVFPLGLLKDEHEIIALFSIIKKHNIDTIITIPSFMERFLSLLQKNKTDLKLEKIITSGEFLVNSLKEMIYKITGAESFSTYASSEFFVGYQCKFSSGYHYDPNYIKINVNKNNKLFFTLYDSEIVPIYKYPLGDLGHIEKIDCKCGDKLPQVFLDGREKNIFILSGGVNVFPYQIIKAIRTIKTPIKECRIIIFNNSPGQDKIVFDIGTNEKINKILLKKISENLRDMSLDFSDICAQEIVKFKVNNFISFYEGNKMLLTIDDKRSYEK